MSKIKRKYEPLTITEWHPKQTRGEDWNVFVTLDQSNESHVQAFGCRVCGQITFNSAFIHEREQYQVCLYHDSSFITLKTDWLPNGVKIRPKRKCSLKDGPVLFKKFCQIRNIIKQIEND